MKGFDKIITSLWIIAACIFWIQGCLGIGIDDDYIGPFLEAIYCTALAIFYKIKEKRR